MLQDLEKEAERRFERFAVRALTSLGDQLGAHNLVLAIWDSQQELQAFLARLSRNNGAWRVEVEAPSIQHGRPAPRLRPRARFILKSQFCYSLDLPHRWSGMLTVEYRGITFLSPDRDVQIRRALNDFGKDVTILLLGADVARLERSLTDERKMADETRAFVATLSKELYCVSSISNALVQSFNVEEVLPRVLEHLLPVLGARLGVIYFSETGQCISLRTPRSKPQEKAEPWFTRYFQQRVQLMRDPPDGNAFIVRRLEEHPRFPEKLKVYLATHDIDAVMEFALHCRKDFLGLGLLGLRQDRHHPETTRLLMISLNMIGLFLEHIALREDLDRQVRLISQENLEMERRNRFLLDYMGTRQAPGGRQMRRVSPTDRLFDEIERSRNTTLLAELASGVAHQIRNPLSNLLYALHLLREQSIPEEEKRSLIEAATERVEIINRTITQFIQYTRLPDLKLNAESINEVLRNTLRSFEGWMTLQDIELQTSFDPHLPPTRLDMFLINQAFDNIIKNAMEAMQGHGHLTVSTRKLTIKHGPEPRLEFAEIIFEDNGPGIAPEDLDKVIKPFYSRKENGLGLGLALVDHVIRAHGGAIALESRNERGTRLKIYLPIR